MEQQRLLTIAIIDDSEDDRESYIRALRKIDSQKYRVIEAADGQSGIELCRAEKPDCILLDYSLPGKNGINVLHELRTHLPYTAVVMLTGQGNETVAVEVMKAGAQDYLTKNSITSTALHHCIGNAVAHCTLQNRLEQKRQYLEIFTRAMAHDLKEPVRAIISFSEIIDTHQLSPECGEYLNYILKSAQHMETLIQNVSRYTKLEVCEALKTESISLESVLEQAKSNLHQLIELRNVRISHQPLPFVAGEASMLTQVMQNLIVNAIHYCINDIPEISITAEQKDDVWQISISDNGPGIPLQYREAVFTPFKRLSDRSVEGTGLGLAICRKIIELHQGLIWCESAPGGGSAFFLTLPLAQAPNEPMEKKTMTHLTFPKEAYEMQGEEGQLAEILLVEDNPTDALLTRVLLMESAGVRFRLHVVNNGEEALHWLKEQTSRIGCKAPDLVLLDINMPRMDGFEVLQALGAEDKLRNIPVSMLSTSNDEGDICKAREFGAMGYMVKPANLDQLREVIEKVPGLQLVPHQQRWELQRVA